MPYERSFYETNLKESRDSHIQIAQWLWNSLKPRSAVDVGCATGRILSELRGMGCSKVLGIDYGVPDDLLLLKEGEYTDLDLTKPRPTRWTLFDRFDLAICLEVGEHLPEANAKDLVWLLCHLSDTIFFSAADVGQAGEQHVNCQHWDYWLRLFEKHGRWDIDKPVFHESVLPWYRRNAYLLRKC